MKLPALSLSLLLFTVGACTPAGEQATPKAETPSVEKTKPLVLYSGRSQVLIEGILKDFTAETGIQVETRFDKSTQTLANRLASECEKTPAYLFFAQDSGYLGALASRGLLSKLPQDLLDTVPKGNQAPEGQWVATSGRARVLVFDPAKVKAEELPTSLAELADERWKGQLGWAPSNASFQAHVSALRHIWGESETETWLKSVQALEPKIYPKNSPQVKAVSNGEITIGWLNHYYLHKLQATNPELKAANYSFTKPGDAGNLMMLSGIGVTAASKQPEAAQKLIRYLLSKPIQARFTQEIFEYPSRSDVPPNTILPDIRERMVQVDQTHLADIGGTLNMLRSLNLQ